MRHSGLRICLLLLALTFAARPAAVDAQDRPSVERVSLVDIEDGLLVRIHASARVPAYTEPVRIGRGGLDVTLFNTSRARRVRVDEARDALQDVSLEPSGNHLKLRMTLADGVQVIPEIFRDATTSDLVVALRSRPAAPSVAENTRAPGSDNGRPSTAGERWRLDTIVIDAGHGGRDHGAVANGVREKDVVLSVAKKLGDYLESNLNVNVVYTRETDEFVELRNRGRIANEAGGKLFVSIHANSAPNRSAYGTETFFLGPYRTEAARRVMETENRVVLLESDPEHYDRLDEDALIRQTLAYSSYLRKSEELADLIERQFEERVGRNSRGVKQAPFYVLWSASMPSILVELGFLTNRDEARFLASDDGQTYLASAIFRAIRDFKEQYERGLNLITTD